MVQRDWWCIQKIELVCVGCEWATEYGRIRRSSYTSGSVGR